ncbi:GerAB/ArcD/ProY family transporter [Lederbergia graminis]|uniref:GerAB/ArcD/ProY family transporter n=1 Tax=Lederbergia graminis TaxID=735518 RepID=A0ABW0LNV6_9BACI
MTNQISISQFCIIIVLTTGIKNLVQIVPLILASAGRDAWISVIVGYLLILPFLFIWTFANKKLVGISIFDWIEMNYSKVFRQIVVLLFVAFLLVEGFTTVMETTSWTNNTYLIHTPKLVVALAVLGSSLYISYGKLKVVAICGGVLIPFVIVLQIFVAIGTIKDSNYLLLLPILIENRWLDVFQGALFVFASMAEIIILLMMLQHQIIKKVTFKHLFFLSFVIFIVTIVPVIDTIAIFGAEEALRIKYPVFLIWRILGIGEYFNHLDFLSIYQWLAGTFIRLALILYLITNAFNMKKPLIIQMLICIFYLFLIIAPISDMQIFSFLQHYYYLSYSIFAVAVTILLFLLIKLKNRMSASDR